MTILKYMSTITTTGMTLTDRAVRTIMTVEVHMARGITSSIIMQTRHMPDKTN